MIIEIKEDIKSLKESEIAKQLICSFLNINFKMDYITVSLQNKENLDNLLNKIYNHINPEFSEKNLIPINQVIKLNSDNNSKIDYQGSFSIILLGKNNAGKSSFMLRYTENEFSEFIKSSIGINSSKQTLKIDGNYYQLTLWDTAGQERFRSMPRKYYRNANGILLLFDINDKESFDDVSIWMSEVEQNCGESKDGKKVKGILSFI
jgi:predicted GTPase